jgi:hypothetical protein
VGEMVTDNNNNKPKKWGILSTIYIQLNTQHKVVSTSRHIATTNQKSILSENLAWCDSKTNGENT